LTPLYQCNGAIKFEGLAVSQRLISWAVVRAKKNGGGRSPERTRLSYISLFRREFTGKIFEI
jgi:hypothetical protein|tara:strand:- start:1976 stop:2161 length:186 start_codon:yes stop_codon:yes gene_type:complete